MRLFFSSAVNKNEKDSKFLKFFANKRMWRFLIHKNKTKRKKKKFSIYWSIPVFVRKKIQSRIVKKSDKNERVKLRKRNDWIHHMHKHLLSKFFFLCPSPFSQNQNNFLWKILKRSWGRPVWGQNRVRDIFFTVSKPLSTQNDRNFFSIQKYHKY